MYIAASPLLCRPRSDPAVCLSVWASRERSLANLPRFLAGLGDRRWPALYYLLNSPFSFGVCFSLSSASPPPFDHLLLREPRLFFLFFFFFFSPFFVAPCRLPRALQRDQGCLCRSRPSPTTRAAGHRGASLPPSTSSRPPRLIPFLMSTRPLSTAPRRPRKSRRRPSRAAGEGRCCGCRRRA